jgi:hypothetical protein
MVDELEYRVRNTIGSGARELPIKPSQSAGGLDVSVLP